MVLKNEIFIFLEVIFQKKSFNPVLWYIMTYLISNWASTVLVYYNGVLSHIPRCISYRDLGTCSYRYSTSKLQEVSTVLVQVVVVLYRGAVQVLYGIQYTVYVLYDTGRKLTVQYKVTATQLWTQLYAFKFRLQIYSTVVRYSEYTTAPYDRLQWLTVFIS